MANQQQEFTPEQANALAHFEAATESHDLHAYGSGHKFRAHAVTKSGRIDATLGLGCFSRTEAQALIRSEVDYYEPTLGDKRDGKIVSVTDDSYTILDCETSDRHVFKFHV